MYWLIFYYYPYIGLHTIPSYWFTHYTFILVYTLYPYIGLHTTAFILVNTLLLPIYWVTHYYPYIDLRTITHILGYTLLPLYWLTYYYHYIGLHTITNILRRTLLPLYWVTNYYQYIGLHTIPLYWLTYNCSSVLVMVPNETWLRREPAHLYFVKLSILVSSYNYILLNIQPWFLFFVFASEIMVEVNGHHSYNLGFCFSPFCVLYTCPPNFIIFPCIFKTETM